MWLLFLGDVVGEPGRKGVREFLSRLPAYRDVDLVIANGENAASGNGLTFSVLKELFSSGIDVLTGGNHIWDKKEGVPFVRDDERILRPANYPRGNPGRGAAIVPAAGRNVGVLNLSGQLQLAVARSPFPAADAELAELERRGADVLFVDFHAEVTSEKVAMGWHLDGRVAAVFGTHTHVPTADGRVLPGGTAFISDVGMTGSRTSVLGVKPEQALASLITQMPTRFETAEEDVWVMGALVEVNQRGLADSFEQVMVPAAAAPA